MLFLHKPHPSPGKGLGSTCPFSAQAALPWGCAGCIAKSIARIASFTLHDDLRKGVQMGKLRHRVIKVTCPRPYRCSHGRAERSEAQV